VRLVRLPGNNRLAPTAANWVNGGACTDMIKLGGANAVRPIVPQSLLSRLTGKTAPRQFRARATRALGPWQLDASTASDLINHKGWGA